MVYRSRAFPALLFLAAAIAAQAQYKAPRTPDGQPDLQGIWSNASLTPFERPAALAGKEFFTEKEAADYLRQMAQQNNRDKRAATPEEDVGQAYNEAWFDRGSQLSPNMRTSVVIDPKDGRVPALTAQAREAVAKRGAQQRRLSETARDFTLNVRCLLWGTAGPPMLAGPYNNNYQIVQNKDYVAIQVEMIHDTRIIPLDGRKHLDPSVRPWMGDSIGHFEGDTLVVDTTNFRDDYSFRGSDANLHLTERFTRTAPGLIRYQFTVDDPSAFARQWTGEVMMTSAPGPLFEYACHEGNEALADMLRGARAQEKTALEKK
jgi:hypothetical protein